MADPNYTVAPYQLVVGIGGMLLVGLIISYFTYRLGVSHEREKQKNDWTERQLKDLYSPVWEIIQKFIDVKLPGVDEDRDYIGMAIEYWDGNKEVARLYRVGRFLAEPADRKLFDQFYEEIEKMSEEVYSENDIPPEWIETFPLENTPMERLEFVEMLKKRTTFLQEKLS